MPGFAVKAATVLGTTDGTDAKGKSVRMFAIKVETQGGGQWSTAKRYTEFKELEAEMELGGLEVEAKLPKKKLTHGKKTLEKRRLALQRWLDSAISHHADHGILVQFLAQPTASADDAPAERKPPPPEFADVFELFGKLPDEGADAAQLLGRDSTAAALDGAIEQLFSEADPGGPLAVGFSTAGGGED
eukprot:COSAG04_NODE_2298_length_4363_cov_6.625820_6_plen_187_part_01